MAAKRTAATAKKKTPAKTSAPAARKKAPQRSASGRMTAESIRQRNQVRAVVLFACAIFLACLVLVTGDNLWRWAHGVLLGLFGSWALLWPVLMIYVSIVTALEKPHGSISGKIWLTVAIIALCCAAGYIFKGIQPASGTKFFAFVSALYTGNTGIGGGVTGGMLGLPLMRGLGATGAKIIVLLLLFVAVMLLTGTTLVTLFRAIRKPVDVVSNGLHNARQRREEERQILESEQDIQIDIPIESQMPTHPVRVETAQLFPKPEPKKKTKEKNEKLDRLKEVFGFEEVSSKTPESVPEQPPEEVPPVLNDDDFELKVPGRDESQPPAPDAEEVELLTEDEAVVFSSTGYAPLEEDLGIVESREGREASSQGEAGAEDGPAEATPEQQLQYNAAEQQHNTYIFPPVSMLAQSANSNPAQEAEELQNNGNALVDILKSFGVQTRILDICRGPAVTRYEIQPAAGVKISKITGLADDLALNLAATGVRIEAPIPGKAAVGIEVPNKTRSTVRMRELVESNAFITSKSKISVALGRDITGQPVIADLARMPHLLIAGTTGSGKSVCINSLIISMLYKATSDDVRFLMIDPKAVELTEYNGMPHMLVPVVTDPKKASGALSWAVSEMMKRYKIFSECNVRNLKGYNSLAESMEYQDENGQPMPAMPQIVIIIDELADLMMAAPKEVEDSICRLAQLARAAGMHLVVATQRPSVDVVTGLIKANIPSRIALTVSNAVDSRTILDAGGAEKLLGNGDMLFAPVDANKPVRVQGCYVTDEEISSIVSFVKKSKALDYDASVLEEIERNAASAGEKDEDSGSEDSSRDPMLDEAIKCVVEAGQASTSLLQRRLRLGYARAGRIIDEMEQLGVVGPHEGSKPRQVLMTYAQWMEKNLQKPDPTDTDD